MRLVTFDIFGTVVDWRAGLGAEDFDRIVDVQGREEQARFRPYREIVKLSLMEVRGMKPEEADRIAANAGRWPLFPDSREALRRIQAVVPCGATTNSDRAHGEQVQEQLGFRLAHWFCAEDLGFYKPSPKVWEAVSRICPFGPDWWHVSAYADYDLDVANRLGLTTVFVSRPHARPGRAAMAVKDLVELAEVIECRASK